MEAPIQIGNLALKTRIQLIKLIEGNSGCIGCQSQIELVADFDGLVDCRIRHVLETNAVFL